MRQYPRSCPRRFPQTFPHLLSYNSLPSLQPFAHPTSFFRSSPDNHMTRGFLTASVNFRGFMTRRLSTEARRLEGKAAIITGGASGIGAATAREMVRQGATVVIADVEEETGVRLCRLLRPHAHFFRCDVSAEDDVAGAVDFALRRLGRLDVMFNNAGVAGRRAATPAEIDVDDFRAVVAVNVGGAVSGVKHAARAMISAGRGGSIVCTASVASVVALKTAPAYTISKHAVVGVVKSAAADLAPHGIRVNCVSPYGLVTPLVMNCLRAVAADVGEDCVAEGIDSCTDFRGARLGVDDVAKVVVFLSSDDGRYISGHNLVIDGGFSSSKDFDPLKSYGQMQPT